MKKSINNCDYIYLLNKGISESVWCFVSHAINHSVESFIHNYVFDSVRNVAYININNPIKSVIKDLVNEINDE